MVSFSESSKAFPISILGWILSKSYIAERYKEIASKVNKKSVIGKFVGFYVFLSRLTFQYHIFVHLFGLNGYKNMLVPCKILLTPFRKAA